MPVRSWRARVLSSALLLILLLLCRTTQAAIVRGTVTNSLGIPIIHASVVLLQNARSWRSR